MAAQIYPTSPMPVPPGAHAEGVDHVESSGKPEGMLSKVKRKATHLKHKIMKATGTDSTDNDHGDINRRDQNELHQHAPSPEDEEVHEGAESCEDDEEHDDINPADNQFKHQQLHSIGALESQEGGPEVEVHGDSPVTALGVPYKNDGSPDALEAAPTKYPETDNDPLPQLGDGVKSLSLEHSPHGEAAEPEKNQHENWSKWSEVKDEGSSPTSPPATLDGVTDEPNAVAQSHGTGEILDNRTSAFAKGTDYPNTSVEEKPISDTADSNNTVDGAVAMRVGGGDRAPNLEDDEHVDALSKPPVSVDVRKDVGEEDFYEHNDVRDIQFREGLALSSGDANDDALNSTLPGSGNGKLQGLKDTVAPTLSYGNTSSPHTDGAGDGEENFSPAEQQTGFVQGPKADEVSHTDEGEQSRVAEREHEPGIALGSGDVDEDALNNSLPGSDIGKLQGLKDTVPPTLSYSNMSSSRTDAGGDREEHPYFATEDEQTGFVQGPNDTGVSTFGYGKEPADDEEVSHTDEGEQSRVAEGEQKPGIALGRGDADEDALNSTLPGSGIEGLKDTVAPGNTSAPRTDSGGDGQEHPREDVNFSPTQQQTGFVPADEVSHRDEDEQSRVAEREHKPEVDIDGSQRQTGASQGLENEVDIDGRQPQTGASQGLENLVATAGELPSPPENLHTPVVTKVDSQPRYDDDGEHAGVGKAGYVSSSVAGDDADREGESHSPGVFQGMKNMLGYNGAKGAGMAETGHATHEEIPAVSSTEGKSHSQQQTGVFQGMRNMMASTFGYNSSEGAHTADTATHD